MPITSKDEAKLVEFLENHPDILEAEGEDEKDPKFFIHQKLRLHRSYDRWQTTICFVDFIRQADLIRDEAFQQLITDEKARQVRDGTSFKSDAFYKGVIASIAGLKGFIEQRIEDLEDVVTQWTEVNNTEDEL
jgi:hypothetical protein